jgi:hypothetical protein
MSTIALLTCSMPALCSSLALAMSAMMVGHVLDAAHDLAHGGAGAVDLAGAGGDLVRPSRRSAVLISLAALAERWARLRTSPATTAKPRPCSPARAASTAAFRARIFVWKAMPSMTLMMSTILREDSLIEPMVATTSATTAPPSPAMRRRLGQPVRFAGVVGVLAHGRGQLFHRGGGFFERAGLLLGAHGQVRVAAGDFARGGGDRAGAAADAADDAGQRADMLAARAAGRRFRRAFRLARRV